MKKFRLAVFLLLMCSSVLRSDRPHFTVILLCGRCGSEVGAGRLQLPRAEEKLAARVAAEDVAECYDAVIKLTSIPELSQGEASELDILLEVLHPSLFNSTSSAAIHNIAVIYTGCSQSLVIIANILSTNVYQVPLLSFSLPYYPSHVSETKYHTRMIPNEAHLPPATVVTIQQFGWQRVALLTEDTPAFLELAVSLQSDLKSEGVSIHHQLTLDSSPLLLPPDTHTLFSEDVKIFILNMSPNLARAVLCQAQHTLQYPGYVWIMHGWFPEGWWVSNDTVEEGERRNMCTNDQLAIYLEGSISISLYPGVKEKKDSMMDIALASGGSGHYQPSCLKSSSELMTELHARTTTDPSFVNSLYLISASLVYDAVWTAANTYFSAPMSNNYPDIINTVHFHGASGPVSFKNGDRDVTNLTLVQYRILDGDLQQVPIATISPSTTQQTNNNSHNNDVMYDVIYCEGENPSIIWPNGRLPLDGTPIEVEHFPYPAVMGIVYTYSVVGVMFAVACFFFNLVFRKKKLIKLTSPNLNNIIVLGAIISYLSALTFFYPQGASSTGIAWGCNLRAWSVSFGFSVCYGTLNVKMWRVYAICRNPKPTMSKTFIKDYHLMLLVLVFVLVDTIILVVVMSLDNSRFRVTIIPNKQDTTPHIREDGIKEISVVSRCLSTTEPYWISLLFGYKAIIQAIGLYLAFKIRNIKIRGLNDSREVSIILYITSVLMIVILVNNFVFGDYIDVDGAVYGIGLSSAVTVVLCLTFIPKMVSLYLDPDGKNIFMAPTTEPRTDPSEVASLQKRIRELEKQVTLARSNENLLDITPPLKAPPSSVTIMDVGSSTTSNCSPVRTTSE